MSNPLYRKGDLVDMYVYLSEEPYLYNREKGELIWKELELGLATSPERQVNYTYHPSQASGSSPLSAAHVTLLNDILANFLEAHARAGHSP